MSISQTLLSEFDIEMAHTRRSLDRVPDSKLAWKPHPKSSSLGWLASHLAHLPAWATITVGKDFLDLAPGGTPAEPEPEATSRAELLKRFDRNVLDARAAIAGASDKHLLSPWSLLKNGTTMLSMPRMAVLRNFVISHAIHHRAQLGVYLRLNNIPVPSIYGPSADEGSM